MYGAKAQHQPLLASVEVAFADDAVLVRHSHDQSGPVLSFSHSEWKAFLVGARHGEFDLP
jgi:hypothetical protein